MQPDVNEVGRDFLPHWPVGRVGHADGHTVALEAVGYFIIEPRFVAKLDSVSGAFPVPQSFYKFLQPAHIFFQKRRKLPDDSDQSFSQRRRRFATTNHGFFNVDQLFVVRDVAMAFDRKRKSVRRFIPPFPERTFFL